MKRSFILHPLLFALYPTLYLYSHNIHQVKVSETLLPLGASVCLFALLFAASRLMFRNSFKSACFVSLFLIVCFLYGPAVEAIKGWIRSASSFQIHTFLVPASCLVLCIAALLIGRMKKSLMTITATLNIFASSLFLLSAAHIVFYEIRESRGNSVLASNMTLEFDSSRFPNELPNIYYIILDRYCRQDNLAEFYDFDNSEFIEFLENRGFYVAAESNANYLCTAQSLASSLNMRHLTFLTDVMGRKSDNWLPVYRMLQHHEVGRVLKSIGYKYEHYGSRWHPTSRNMYADKNHNVSVLPEFSALVFRTTLFYPVFRLFGLYDSHRVIKYKRVLCQLGEISRIPEIREPTFVFVHFLLPHDPYVFKDNGEFKTESEEKRMGKKENYLEQIAFVNSRIEQLVDKLLTDSDTPPIIIIQSDEGEYPERRGEAAADWRNADEAQLRHKMGILNAYYLPGVGDDAVYPDITPVNTFRIIFDRYFQAKLGRVEDVSYIYPDEKRLYDFVRVPRPIYTRTD